MADFGVTNTFVAGTDALASEVNTNFTEVEDVFNGDRDSYTPVPTLVPIGGIIAWHKTWGSADSGTTDGSTTANKLIQSGQNFETTIKVGMIVFNSTDNTFANVTAVDSDTQLSINADIMATGEAFTIYKTPQLPDGWLECDGATISDADSPLNGVAVPALNGTTDATKGFIRGVDASTTDDAVTDVTHNHGGWSGILSSAGQKASSGSPLQSLGTTQHSHSISSNRSIPPYAEMVWIIKIK